jgi:hypothetical protein
MDRGSEPALELHHFAIVELHQNDVVPAPAPTHIYSLIYLYGKNIKNIYILHSISLRIGVGAGA